MKCNSNNIAMTEQEAKDKIMEGQKQLITELLKELRRLQLKNLKLRLHMQVLVSHPLIKEARKLRAKYAREKEVSRDLLTGSMN